MFNMSSLSAPAKIGILGDGATYNPPRSPGSCSSRRSHRSDMSEGILPSPDMARSVSIDPWSGIVTPPVVSRKNSFTGLNLSPASNCEDRISNCSTRDESIDAKLASAARRLSISSQVSEANASEVAEAIQNFSDDIDPNHHALNKTWGLWEKRAWTDKYSDEDEWHYRQNCKAIKDFNTIESFMQLFNGCPKPSAILNKEQMVRNFEGQPEINVHPAREAKPEKRRRGSILGLAPMMKNQKLDSVMFFEQGVFPSWEDPAHHKGGQFQFVFKTDFPAQAIDQVWEHLVFNVMGNGFDGCENVTGIRLCDKLNTDAFVGTNITTPRTAVRIEIWHRELGSTEERIAFLAEVKQVLSHPLLCGGSTKRQGKSKRSGDIFKTVMCYAPSEDDVQRNSMDSDKRNSIDKTN